MPRDVIFELAREFAILRSFMPRVLSVSLWGSGYVTEAERPHVKKVLDAAALTYLASAFVAVMMLVRFILLLTMVSRRN